MEKTQREYYLNEQLKAIQKELGENEEGRDEAAEFEERIKNTKLSKEAREKALAEVKKLRSMSPMSAEADRGAQLPRLDPVAFRGRSAPASQEGHQARAMKHSRRRPLRPRKGQGADPRISRGPATQRRKMKGPILCLVGPPGVGKTSLGKSVARATGRNFVRMSLGGVRDEAEIRGHRRTYIGSHARPDHPVDEEGQEVEPAVPPRRGRQDWRRLAGRPRFGVARGARSRSRTTTFNDHYLEVDYDLSDVMFVTTANTTRGFRQALLDRMEVIRISGYTEDEKVQIAKRHLIPEAGQGRACA